MSRSSGARGLDPPRVPNGRSRRVRARHFGRAARKTQAKWTGCLLDWSPAPEIHGKMAPRVSVPVPCPCPCPKIRAKGPLAVTHWCTRAAARQPTFRNERGGDRRASRYPTGAIQQRASWGAFFTTESARRRVRARLRVPEQSGTDPSQFASSHLSRHRYGKSREGRPGRTQSDKLRVRRGNPTARNVGVARKSGSASRRCLSAG